jgi:CheY-like chemotaxis protein
MSANLLAPQEAGDFTSGQQLTQKIRVMCVDDDEEIMSLYATIFPRNDFVLSHVACDGEEAVKIIEQTNDIDVLILEERVPKMKGTEVANRIRLIRPNMKIIMVSVLDIPLSGQKLFDAVLTKPASTKELVNAVRQVTGN